MLKIGITGGIGTGKSTVCKIFEILQIPIYYADYEAKFLYDNNPILKSQLIHHFGEGIYAEGKFNRNALSKVVFSNEDKLQLLNTIVHPIVLQHGKNWFEKQKAPFAIKEAALLIESGSYHQLDALILVQSPLELRIKRVMHRDEVNESAVKARIAKQMPEEEKIKFAQYMIQNDEKQLLIPQVQKIYNSIISLKKI